MNRKLRYILLLVTCAGIGTTWILSAWVHDSYHKRGILFLHQVEFNLFDAIQEHFQSTMLDSTYQRTPNMHPQYPDRSSLRTSLLSTFPSLDHKAVDRWLENEFVRDPKHPAGIDKYFPPRNPRMFPPSGSRSFNERQQGGVPMLPPVSFSGRKVNAADARDIKALFEKRLKRINKHIDYQIKIFRMTPDEFIKQREDFEMRKDDFQQEIGRLETKPILLDLDNETFIAATIHYPITDFIIENIGWQLIIACCILGSIIIAFIYLFYNLLQQNKLDVLRRDFINSLTHELRTPVSTVSAALQAISIPEIVNDTALSTRYRTIAEEELQHLSEMIDKVLLLADERSINQSKLNFSHFDLSELIEGIVTRFQAINPIKVTFHWHKPTDIQELVADPHLMKSVIENLIENAIKYGATTVEIALKTVAEKQVPCYTIEIKDDGVGIHPAHQQQIFKPFFRIPQGDIYSVKGFGLGLPYVQWIVQEHRGRIKLNSALGKGATFTIIIPKSR